MENKPAKEEGPERNELPVDSHPRLHRNPELLHALTEREWEVLDLQAQGLGYKEIVDRLGISDSTVKNHLTHVREKLHARNAIDAINKAYGRFAGKSDKFPI